jgi:integrase
MIDHITQSKIPKYQPSADKKAIRVYMDDRTGLNLYVTRNGSRAWDYQFKIPATKTTGHYKIGDARIITVNEAKDIVVDLRRLVASGIDPRDSKKQADEIPDFDTYISEQYLPYVQSRKRSANRDEQIYRIHVRDRLGKTRLDRITRMEIQQLHSDVRAKGYKPASADHVAKFIRHALNLAVDWLLLEKNPASRLPLYNEDNKIENYLTDGQLADLVQVLRNDHNRPVCSILMFLLSTGARLQEALDASWNQIDLDNRLWRIPAKGTKSKKARVVPLNDTALELLITNRNNGSEVCFPNPKTKKSFVTITRVWHRLRKQIGIPHFRIHDLRHSYASFMANSGRSLYEIQQLLGHADSRVTQRYSHLTASTLQAASNTVADKIKAASGEN